MSKFLLTTLIASFCISVIYAQSNSNTTEDKEFYCKALNQYLYNLDHHNAGVVESSIIQLMKLKRECPDIPYQTTIDTLDALITNGKTSNIRFLAFIAARYLQNPKDPGLFTDIKIENDVQLITMLLNHFE